MGWLDDLIRDLRHACRLLWRSPVFAAIAVMSLALGIGATSAIFSLADASLLRPLPVADPNAVVTISAAGADDRRGAVSLPNYRDLRDQSQSFDGMIAYQRSTFSFAQSRDAVREMRVGVLVSDNFFNVLGVQPFLGRSFLAEEGRVAGRDAVVVLAYDFWKNVLAADGSIVNRIVSINGVDFTVIGVAPESFTGMDAYIRPAFYAPIMMADRLSPPRSPGMAQSSALDDRAVRSFVVKGRLKPAVSQRQAQAELSAIWSRLERDYPDVNRNRTLTVRSELQSRLQSDPVTAGFMAMLTVLVTIVLVIACANVANLMLGRARARSREIAIRMALGVGPARLLRQLLTESGVIALTGCALGVAFAYGGIRVFNRITFAADVPIMIAPQLNTRVLVVSLLAALMSAAIFGLAPAWQSLKTQLVPALKSAEPGEAKGQRTIGRSALVVAQVALSMALLVATATLVDGFRKAVALDPGFRIDHLLMMSLDTSFVRYSPSQTLDFYRALAARARTLPGVASVALTSAVPLDRGGTLESVIPEGYQFPQGQDHAAVFSAVVDDQYFTTMNTGIVHGRAFTTADTDASRRVAIVNQAFADSYWPHEDPIGKRLRLTAQGPWLEVVGITGTGKYLFIGEAPTRFLYLPFAQNQRTAMSLLVETTSPDAAPLAAPLREAVKAIDADQPVFNVRTVSGFYQTRAIAVLLRTAQLVGALGLLGLTLALIGLYGLVAYSVARRTREIGIRMAIGAGRPAVLKMILRQGLMLSIAGVAVGSVASFLIARVLKAALVGLGTPNPAIYVIVPIALVGLTIAASYIPARRASLVDPLSALRYE
jgi:putative ABC transport system permease protein